MLAVTNPTLVFYCTGRFNHANLLASYTLTTIPTHFQATLPVATCLLMHHSPQKTRGTIALHDISYAHICATPRTLPPLPKIPVEELPVNHYCYAHAKETHETLDEYPVGSLNRHPNDRLQGQHAK